MTDNVATGASKNPVTNLAGRAPKQMSIFKKRQKPTTHIVKREETISPLRAAVTGGNQGSTRNWEIKRDEFRTFDSPPGRF